MGRSERERKGVTDRETDRTRKSREIASVAMCRR